MMWLLLESRRLYNAFRYAGNGTGVPQIVNAPINVEDSDWIYPT